MKTLWEKDKATKWRIKFKATSRPLRIESLENEQVVSRCINLAEDRWLNSGDYLFITLRKSGETHFVTIKWIVGSKGWGRFTQVTNAYYYSQGVIRDKQLIYDKGPELLMSEGMIGEGVGLGDFIKRSKADFRKRIGTIDEDWWNTFNDITLVRERRNDFNSRVGVLIADELFRQSDLKVYKNYQDENSIPLTPQEQEAVSEIPSSATVIYGFEGYKNSLALKLSDEIVDDNIWGQIVYVTLTHPQYWPLPPQYTQQSAQSNDKDFIITSTNDYIPLDGYFIDVGNSPHSFYAKAKVDASLNFIEIND